MFSFARLYYKTMKIFTNKSDILKKIKSDKAKNLSIGFVPTMGALHVGHISLVKSSLAQNNITVVSIFVNPTQFNNPEDLLKYPITTDKDLELLEKNNVDYVFLPSASEIYSNNIESEKYSFGNLERVMEGEHREGHFDGVATIVKLLFETTIPTRAYFGEKDFQQLQIVKKLVEITGLDLEIVPCAIVRENDGLAMSSRNVRLTSDHRKEAPFIYKVLKEAKVLSKNNSVKYIQSFIEDKFLTNKLLNLEYFEIREENDLSEQLDFQDNKKYRAFIAVYADNIRLIDNIRVF